MNLVEKLVIGGDPSRAHELAIKAGLQLYLEEVSKEARIGGWRRDEELRRWERYIPTEPFEIIRPQTAWRKTWRR